MENPATLSFLIRELDESHSKTLSVIAIINGVALTEIIANFELKQGFEPAGEYAGLVPQHFNFGPLDAYFLGLSETNSGMELWGKIYLLGCECGDVGCWPLEARIQVKDDKVFWDSFGQPHRPAWDY